MRLTVPPPFLPIFSFRPGIKVMLPGSTVVLEAFPTALRLAHRELFFPKLGVPRDWKVVLDPMRRTVCLEGRGAEGFFRIRIDQTAEGLCLQSLKGPLEVRDGSKTFVVQRSEPMALAKDVPESPRPPLPRLLLGCNKALCWDRISVSSDMNEVLPLWYQFGSPCRLNDEPSPTLFGAVIEAIRTKNRLAVFEAFQALFRAGTEGIFVPKRVDDGFLGYPMPPWPDGMEDVFSHVGSAIRSLFLTEEDSVVTLLPCLPKECIAGRLLREPLLSGHTISLEWRKGLLRRVLLKTAHDGFVTLRSSMGSGYIRASSGRKKPFFFAEPLEVRRGEEYLIDNFSSARRPADPERRPSRQDASDQCTEDPREHR